MIRKTTSLETLTPACRLLAEDGIVTIEGIVAGETAGLLERASAMSSFGYFATCATCKIEIAACPGQPFARPDGCTESSTIPVPTTR